MDFHSPVVDGDSPLHVAVRLSHLDDIRKILYHQDVDVNVLNSKHETPLNIACVLRKSDSIELFVAFGANPFIKDFNTYKKSNFDVQDLLNRLLFQYDHWIKGPMLTNGDAPLHTAVRLGRLENIQKMLDHELEINRANSNHETPLHLACALGHKHIVHFLMSNGAEMYVRDRYNNAPIHRAVSQGHVDIVEYLINIFLCNPMIKGYQGRTLLHFACGIGNIELVNILIQKYGINPCATDAVDQTPLHIAASHGQGEVVSLLITEYSCPINCRSNSKLTPLHLACYCGHSSIIKKLVIEHKADLNACDADNATSLFKAVQGGQSGIVRELMLEFDCSPLQKGFEGRSLLHQACQNGKIELLIMLITDFNLDPLSVDDSGNTPLHMACWGGHEELARLLITKYNCPVDVRNKNKVTPLHKACLAGDSPVVRILVSEFKANVMARDHENDTPINKAVLAGHADIVQMLSTEFESSPQIKGFEGRSLLHQACDKGNIKLAMILITDFVLDPLSTDDNGNTPLHMACWGGHEKLARLLITKYNCPVNVRNSKKQTPLLFACRKGHLNTVRMLVYEHKADLTACDRVNSGPLHIAVVNKHTDIVQMLINEFECNPHAKGLNNKTLLHYACDGGSVKLVEILINGFNFDPLCVDNDGNTPLHIAAMFNWEEIVRLLIIKYKCSVNCINKHSQTLLHLAITKGHINLCITLISEFAIDANVLDKNNETPLTIAMKGGNAKAVHILATEFGCKPNIKGTESKPLLHQLCAEGLSVMLYELISNFKHDPASFDEDGNTLLHIAAQYGQYDVALLLVTTYKCQIDCKNSRGQTPLHYACIGGHTRVAELLVINKAQINIRDESYETPLKEAYTFGNTNVLSVILHILGYDSINLDSKLLHQVCERGSLDLADVLLVDFSLDPCSVTDINGNTPLHIAAFYGHMEIALLLIKCGCPIDCTNFQGETPLHLICSRGLTDPIITDNLIKFFISEFKADVTKMDNNGEQPVHKSAQAGCTNIITTLVFDYGCDPHARGSNNTTLLHQALAAGHTSTAEALIEMFQLSIHSTDNDGDTALHLSSLLGKSESVRLLLYNYHAPVFVRNKSGETAIDLATNDIKLIFDKYTRSKHIILQAEYEKLWSLSSQKYSGQHNITRVFVLGNPGSGKSTLVESLKRKGIMTSRLLVPKDNVPLHTAGIVSSIHQSKDAGRLLYFDFAGDKEYYSSHSAILEMVSHSSIGNSVYVIVANMINDNDTLCTELGYWLSFISYHAKALDSHDKLKVIIVLSHSDLLTSSDSVHKLDAIKYYLKNNSDQLTKWNLNVTDIISSNCRRPRSSKTVVDTIVQMLKSTSPYTLSPDAALLNGALEKDFRNVVTCKFQTLLNRIKATAICLPTEAYALYPIVKELHDIGLLMITGRNKDPLENHLLLMDIPSLTSEVHQLLFSKSAEEKFSSAVSSHYAKMGIFPASLISSILPDHITKECLVQLQYCQEFSHADIGLDYSVTQNTESNDLLLYFPALCLLENEHANWPHDPDLNFSIGWFAKCVGKLDYFPPRYLHVLLLRLTLMFALPASTSPTSDLDLSIYFQAQNCHCTMWKNGIHWLMREGVECIVEVVNESKGVVVVVKSRKQHTYQSIHMLTQIANVVTEAKTEFCNSVSLQYFIMKSDDPSSYSNEDKLCDITLVKSAIENNDETVFSFSGRQTLTLESLKLLKCHTYWGKFTSCYQ